MSASGVVRRFQIALIKPSHYDDDGYVIQWIRSVIPTNSLACVHALIDDARERRVLGEDVDIDIDATDEVNTRIRPNRIVRRFHRHERGRPRRRAACAEDQATDRIQDVQGGCPLREHERRGRSPIVVESATA